MVYELAELGIAIQNCNCNEYLDRRMMDYQSSFGGIRIRANLHRSDRVNLPTAGEHILGQDQTHWLKEPDGCICSYRRVDWADYTLFLARFSPDFTEVDLETRDITGLGWIPVEQLEFYLLGEMVQMMLPMTGRLVLHSSAVACQGHGVAVSAPSGTGKSTHTALWVKNFEDCVILNDDTPIVWDNGSGLRLYGSPWSGKTEQNRNINVPFDALVCLSRGETDTIERISPRVSFPFLLQECKYTPFAEREEKRIALLENVVAQTKIYSLACTPHDSAAQVCKNQIWQEL